MSGIITEPEFLRQFPAMEPMNKSGAIQALVVAIYEIGCLIGAGGIIAFGDKLGRRRSVIIGACIMLVGAAIQTASFGIAQLIVGRIVTGVGNGMNTSTIPVWQSEMAPPKIRGFLVLFEGALITAGIMLAYWLNYGFWFVTQYGSFQWRFPIAFQAVFGVILILLVWLCPEVLLHPPTSLIDSIANHRAVSSLVAQARQRRRCWYHYGLHARDRPSGS